MTYQERLAAFVASGEPLPTAPCWKAGCPVVLQRVLKADLTDAWWVPVDPPARVDGWAALDALVADGSVAAMSSYSRASAHHDLTGLWPGEHAHHV